MNFLIFLSFISVFLEVVELFPLGTNSFTVLDAITIVFVTVFIKQTIWDGKKIFLLNNQASKFLLLFLIGPLLAAFNPLLLGDQFAIIQTFKSMAHFYFTFTMSFLIVLLPLKEKLWVNIIKFLLILSIFVNIFGIYQIFARIFDLPLAWFEFTAASFTFRNQIDEFTQLSLKFENFYRATAIFSEPSALAVFNSVIFLFLVIPYLQKHKMFFSSRWLNITIAVFMLIGEFLAFSLSGLACIALMIFMFFIIESRKKSMKMIGILAVLGVVLIAVDSIIYPYTNVSVLGLFSNRIGSIYNYIFLNKTNLMMGESFATRSNNSLIMLQNWLHSPFTGVGMGLTQYYGKEFLFADIGALAVLAETGIIGAALYVGFSVSFLLLSLKNRKKSDKEASGTRYKQTILGVFVYYWIVFFVENYVSGNQLYAYMQWLFIAMFISLDQIYKYEEGRSKLYAVVKVPWKAKFGEAYKAYINKRLSAKGIADNR